MGKKALRKDFFVEIRKSFNRFLSIFFIVALGVAFFAGVRSSKPDMELSADHYYDQSRLMDLRILGTLGMTEDDIRALREVEGVSLVEGAYFAELYCLANEKELTARVMSITEGVNQLTVTQGRMPDRISECVVDEKLILRNGFQVGDTLTLRAPEGESVKDSLHLEQFTIVGAVITPQYLSLERGTAGIGNGNLDCFVAVRPEAFDMEAYTELYLRVEGAEKLSSYSEEYDDFVDVVSQYIEDNLADERCQIRYDQVVDEAQATLNDAKKDYEDAKLEAETELDSARKKLEDARAVLEDGWVQVMAAAEKLDSGKKSLLAAKKELDAGRRELTNQELQLEDAEAELTLKEKEWLENKRLLESQERQLLDAKKNLETELPVKELELSEGWRAYYKGLSDYRAQEEAFKAGEEALRQGTSKYQEEADKAEEGVRLALLGLLKQGVPVPMQPEQIAQLKLETFDLEAYKPWLMLIPEQGEELVKGIQTLQATYHYLEEQRAILDQGREALKEGEKTLDASYAQLAEGERQLAEGRKQIQDNLEAIADGKKQLADGEKQLKEARRQVDEAKQQLLLAKQELSKAENSLMAGRGQLTGGGHEIEENTQVLKDSEKELQRAVEEYEKARDEADEKLEEARQELIDAQKEIDDLEEPEWYVLDRNTIQTYVEFGQDAQRIGNIGKVFPAIFFLVAALVSLTTMTRMVEEQRTQIGTMKALGYSNGDIAGKYVMYALIASVSGSVFGVCVGGKILPYVIMKAYCMLYENLREYLIPIHMGYSVSSTLLAVFCTVAATIAASYKELLAAPAVLMRPVAPKQGKRVLLEYVTPLWRRLSFIKKATIRNLLRYKKRFFMTVFGIGGCMALLLVGFGLRDSIHAIGEKQYDELWTYDVVVGMDAEAEPKVQEELITAIDEEENVLDTLEALQKINDVRSGETTKSAYLFVPESLEQMEDFVKLQNRETKEPYTLPDDGVIVTEKLASLLGVQPGDSIELKEEEGIWHKVTVAAVAENYLRHYVYVSPNLYRELYGKEPPFDTIFLNLERLDAEIEDSFGKQLLGYSATSGVTFIGTFQKQIDDMLGSLDIIIWVLIISAGLLAFVVLYNLNNINITERKRELATLRVLGFYDLEVAEYVYRENILLTLLGSMAGIFLGIVLHRFVILTAEVDMLMFGRQMKTASYLYSALLTWAFSGFVNFVMYFKLKKIDMVESLKSVE